MQEKRPCHSAKHKLSDYEFETFVFLTGLCDDCNLHTIPGRSDLDILWCRRELHEMVTANIQSDLIIRADKDRSEEYQNLWKSLFDKRYLGVNQFPSRFIRTDEPIRSHFTLIRSSEIVITAK